MSPSLWQGIAIKEINTLFNNADGIRTVILVGSIVDDPTLVDQWSDIDLKIIIDPLILDKYYFETSWLNKLGNVFSVECNSSEHFHTLRICLDDFRRFDITFITTESLIKIENIPIYGNFKVLKNTIFDLDKIIKKIPSNGYKKMSGKELDSFQNAFWHKAIIAITKVMRNDFLIAFHLTLDLARDCLILKMNQRDEYAGTKIHRT